MKKLWMSMFFILFIFSCDSHDKLTAYLKPVKEIELTMKKDNFQDISFLFVIDTSVSMNDKQAILSDNIKLFLEPVFANYPYYNYNFSITTTTPSKKFSREHKPLFLTNNTPCNMFDLSVFVRHARNIGSYLRYTAEDLKKFSHEQLVCILSHNIASAEGFDEDEESYFQSISYIIERADSRFKSDFFGDDKLLVLFFLSDAHLGVDFRVRFTKEEEADKHIAQERLSLIQSVMGGTTQNIHAYAVTIDDKRQDTCGEDYNERGSFPKNEFPFHLYRFIEMVDGFRTSICEKFWGQKLTVVFDDLKQFLYPRVFFLNEVPKLDTVEVFLNGQKLPKSIVSGWSFNPENLSINISSDLNFVSDIMDDRGTPIKDPIVTIRYNPVNIEILRENKDW